MQKNIAAPKRQRLEEELMLRARAGVGTATPVIVTGVL